MRSLLCLAILLAAAPSVVAESPQLTRYTIRGSHMGIIWNISVYAPDEASANKAGRAALKRVGELNDVMSDYDPDSELMRLCRHATIGEPTKVSRDLFHVLDAAQRFSQATNGAFDATVSPVVKLWRRSRRTRKLPDEDALKTALSAVGYRHLSLNKNERTVTFKRPAMRLDLGGIAKGFAADEALKVLKQHGLTRAMVDGGGDIVLGDPPPESTGWRIGIAPLEKPDDPPESFLMLKNTAVATSGDAYQAVEIAGKRYSHIVDPNTGLGLTTRSSVTVIAPTGMQADALASAVSVMGPQRGLKFIKTIPKTEVRAVVQEDGKPREHHSERFYRELLHGET